MDIILYDSAVRNSLLPFTHTRPVADIRCGILTMCERWEKYLHQTANILTLPYLQPLHNIVQAANDVLYINSAVFATGSLAEAINKLQAGQKLIKGTLTIAARLTETITFEEIENALTPLPEQRFDGEVHALNNIWDIFQQNERAIKEDFALLTKGRHSAPLPEYITVTGKQNLFIEEGAIIQPGCIINATGGATYIGKDAEIMEGAIIRGPFAACEHSAVKMGAKIYTGTTIGPGCKVGGEVSNTVFFANSNKGHDGFVGNAVIGEWCNLGADTNCSNLKNNYDEIKIWDEHTNKSIKTGLTFCGLLMGDHSKCSINTMFNTGTVVGVSANIFGSGFPEKFVPSFSWGGSDGVTTYSFDRAIDTANRMMQRRGKQLSDAEKEMYRHIFEHTAEQRRLFTN